MNCELPEGWYKTICRIAQKCASDTLNEKARYSMRVSDRFDTGMDGIIAYLALNGWPEKNKELFIAAANAIQNAGNHTTKHMKYRWTWVDNSGAHDGLAEKITDQVAVRQLLAALSPAEYSAVIALAATGDYKRGAGILGIPEKTMQSRLTRARKTALALWCAPGEHVQPYHPGVSKAVRRRKRDKARERRLAA